MADLDGLGSKLVDDLLPGTGVLTLNGIPVGARSVIPGVAGPFKDGFDALRKLAEKEGMISANKQTLTAADLRALELKYGLAMRVGSFGPGGASESLETAGITEIQLGQPGTETTRTDSDGNIIESQSGARTNLGEIVDGWALEH